jgi:hypothetical protein
MAKEAVKTVQTLKDSGFRGADTLAKTATIPKKEEPNEPGERGEPSEPPLTRPISRDEQRGFPPPEDWALRSTRPPRLGEKINHRVPTRLV